MLNKRMEIDRVNLGNILVAIESMYGRQMVVCGPVVNVDKEESIIGIRTEDGSLRSFPANQLWPVSALFNHLNRGFQHSFNNQRPQPVASNKEIQIIQVLAGFIKSILEGTVSKEMMQEILNEIEKKTNIKPVRGQEALEVLLSLSKHR